MTAAGAFDIKIKPIDPVVPWFVIDFTGVTLPANPWLILRALFRTVCLLLRPMGTPRLTLRLWCPDTHKVPSEGITTHIWIYVAGQIYGVVARILGYRSGSHLH